MQKIIVIVSLAHWEVAPSKRQANMSGILLYKRILYGVVLPEGFDLNKEKSIFGYFVCVFVF